MPDENKHTDFAAMSAPTADHERLTPFVGTFRAEVKICTFELGGRFLRQEYKGDPNDGPFPAFEGHGYWGFNKTTGIEMKRSVITLDDEDHHSIGESAKVFPGTSWASK